MSKSFFKYFLSYNFFIPLIIILPQIFFITLKSNLCQNEGCFELLYQYPMLFASIILIAPFTYFYSKIVNIIINKIKNNSRNSFILLLFTNLPLLVLPFIYSPSLFVLDILGGLLFGLVIYIFFMFIWSLILLIQTGDLNGKISGYFCLGILSSIYACLIYIITIKTLENPNSFFELLNLFTQVIFVVTTYFTFYYIPIKKLKSNSSNI